MIKLKTILITVGFLLITSFALFTYWRFSSLSYELQERKRDEFVIQLAYAIIEGQSLPALKQAEVTSAWVKSLGPLDSRFNVYKDTGFTYVEYYLVFESGLVLFFDTGEKVSNFYGAATFHLNQLAKSNNFEPNKNAPFYFVGPHKVYPH